ncbi:hypothetical protein B0T24DRAFT_600221 [Lasiosphaeria ovina]|uniref:Uncharacterized protein n=1 Tax=Lasiosphaeria ovina TaxID=92902 RepID=A0AAE0MYN0_9PEZI|nr:hypothetical protein B0T24DRAFT_600221 [Lasiosphaeria ovina]
MAAWCGRIGSDSGTDLVLGTSGAALYFSLAKIGIMVEGSNTRAISFGKVVLDTSCPARTNHCVDYRRFELNSARFASCLSPDGDLVLQTIGFPPRVLNLLASWGQEEEELQEDEEEEDAWGSRMEVGICDEEEVVEDPLDPEKLGMEYKQYDSESFWQKKDWKSADDSCMKVPRLESGGGFATPLHPEQFVADWQIGSWDR